MTDEPREITRRNAIVGTAAAAGLVWSKPVVRSVGRLGAVGTPEPSTSGTGPPTGTTYTFGGPFEATFVNLPSEPGCVLNGGVDFPTNVDGVGPATVAENICVNNPGGPVVLLSGSFNLTANGGTLVGTFTGTGGTPQVGNTAHHDITITTGTGIFAGATGTATLDATVTTATPLAFQGTLSGSVTVP